MRKILLFMLLGLHFLSAQVVTIGTETNESQALPIDPAFGYTYAQTIYSASDIGSSGEITSISFTFSGTELNNSNEWTIYMKHRSSNAFISNSDWEPVMASDQVFSGTVYFDNNNKVTIELPTPFNYNGTDNLLIAIDENKEGLDTFANDFHCSQGINGNSIYYRNNSINPDPLAPTTGVLASFFPNIDISFNAILCYTPTNLSASNITSTSANITWEHMVDQNNWEYINQPAGTGYPTGDGIATNSATISLENLSPGTHYEYYVRTVCGSNNYSAWVGPFSYSTECSSISDNYCTNFDSEAINTLPYCWSTYNTTTNATITIGTDSSAPSSPNVINLRNLNNGSDQDIVLISPESTNTGDGMHRIRFQAKVSSTSGGTTLQVGTLSDPADFSTFTSLETITLTNTYEEYTVIFPNNSANYFAFKHGAESTYKTISIDDVCLEDIPSCLSVLDLSLSNLSNNSVDVSWTLQDNGQDTWEYVVQAEGTGEPTTNGTETTSNPVSVSSLDSNTAYEVWVRAKCNTNEYSIWRGPITFNTLCEEFTENFCENFDTTNDGDVPNCWSTILDTTSTGSAAVDTDTSSVSSPNVFDLANAGDSESNILLVSPKSSFATDGLHRVRFQVKGSTGTPIEVGTLSDVTDASTFTAVQSIITTGDWTEYVVLIPNTTDSYFAFKHGNGGTYKTISIDNICVEDVPSCIEVIDLTYSNLTSTSINVGWTSQDNNQDTWEYVVQAEGTGEPTANGTETSSNPISISGLTPNTNYEVWVRAKCADDDYSIWKGPLNLKTLCEPSNEVFCENFDDYESGEMADCWTRIVESTNPSAKVEIKNNSLAPSNPNALELFNSNDLTAKLYAISPENTLISDGNHRIVFSARGSSNGVQLKLVTLANPVSTELTEVTTITLSNSFETYRILLPEGTNNFFAFVHSSTETYKYIYIDDVCLEEVPPCIEVIDAQVNNITATTADLSWTTQDNEQNTWEYVVQPLGTGEPTADGAVTNTNPTTIENLTQNTMYEVWVRANCGDVDGNSIWTGPVTFTTSCAPYTVTFEDSFEVGAMNNQTVLPCWSIYPENANIKTYEGSTVNPTPTHGEFSLRMYGNMNADIVLISPEFSDMSNTKKIEFQVYDKDNGELVIGTMTDPSDLSTFTPYYTLTDEDMVDNEWELKSYTFDSYTGTDTFIAFKFNPSANSKSIYIDEFAYRETACLPVSDVVTNNITASGAKVEWTSGDNNTTWEVAWGETGFDITNPSNTAITEANQYIISGLLNNKTYDVYVRAICGEPSEENYSEWSEVTSLTTCDSYTIEYVQNFDENSTQEGDVENCWSKLSPNANIVTFMGDGTNNPIAYNGDYSVRLKGNFGDEMLLISPQFSDLDNTKQIRFSVYDKDYGKLIVGTMANPYDSSTFTPYHTYNNIDMADDEWDEKVLTFENYTGTDQYIAFQFIAPLNNKSLYIDGFVYELNETFATGDIDLTNTTSIHPNPVKDVITIKGESTIKTATILNTNGNRIRTAKVVNNTINVHDLPSGVYLIVLNTNKGKSYTHKFIKK